MNRWSALAVALAFVVGLALRVPNLSRRPLHNDEAVNAIKATELWQSGKYAYDPDEYHGPTLHYATVPFFWLSGAKNANELGDEVLRWPTVAFGLGLILLLPLFREGLGKNAIAWAAIFMAISPAMVFYSRYFIHEILLVFFAALTIAAGWKYVEKPGKAWALIAGAGVGLMFATKETFVISIVAMFLAVIATVWWTRPQTSLSFSPPGGERAGERGPNPSKASNSHVASAVGRGSCRAIFPLIHTLSALAAALLIWLLFFSSFFTNFHGLADSIRTYLPWLKRAGGQSPHLHPWYFYLQRLVWFHPVKGPIWSEALIVGLSLIGATVSLKRRTSPFAVFLTLYTLSLTAIYSAISYKTPWCLLNFLFGMILLAGIGAAAITEFFQTRPAKFLVTFALLALTAQLAWQSWRTNFQYAADRRNPYVYAQTVPDLLNLVQKVDAVAHVAPNTYDTIVKVIAPAGDYWPLPWYLRRFKNVGWYDQLPADPFAPIIIASSKLDARLDEKSDKKWVMVGLTELRPQRFLELYVELELWKKYVASLPRDRD